MLSVLIIIALFLTFILYCCIAIGDDPVSRAISDWEQMEYIREWQDKHNKRKQQDVMK